MKARVSNLFVLAFAAIVTMVIGCAPPPPSNVDTSVDPSPDQSSNMTADSNVTATAETPATETPAEEPAVEEPAAEEPAAEEPAAEEAAAEAPAKEAPKAE